MLSIKIIVYWNRWTQVTDDFNLTLSWGSTECEDDGQLSGESAAVAIPHI